MASKAYKQYEKRLRAARTAEEIRQIMQEAARKLTADELFKLSWHNESRAHLFADELQR